MGDQAQEFVVEHASATLTSGKTKAHIDCGCREGDIRLTMSRLVLERLRTTINRALDRMQGELEGSE